MKLEPFVEFVLLCRHKIAVLGAGTNLQYVPISRVFLPLNTTVTTVFPREDKTWIKVEK